MYFKEHLKAHDVQMSVTYSTEVAVTSNPGFRGHCEGLCPNKGALSTATTPPPTWGLGADGRHDRPACPRPPTSTMTLSPIDKLLVAGDNETRDGGRSPEHLLPVLNIIRHIYFIISPSLARLRFIIHHIYYGAASPI